MNALNKSLAGDGASKAAQEAAPLPSAELSAVLKSARLRYVSDRQPGFTRRRRGRHFAYYDSQGALLRDPVQLARIRGLVIPPAWTDVWISSVANSHLQATGRDARGRKQYRYHARWSEVRNETKFERLLAFGSALPKLRSRIDEDLRRPGLPREKVLAALVRLLETTLIRIGNEEYARDNESYGLTTLRNDHVEVAGSLVQFHFKGKSGVSHSVNLRDRRLARIIKTCQELPGQELFEYLNEEGQSCRVGSADVNAYLHELTEEEFTAKDFRTWAGTLCAVLALQGIGWAEDLSETQRKKNLVQAIKLVAQRLGNTPAVCRKYYVHPAVLEAYGSGVLLRVWPGALKVVETTQLPDSVAPPAALAPHAVALYPEEVALMKFLKAGGRA